MGFRNLLLYFMHRVFLRYREIVPKLFHTCASMKLIQRWVVNLHERGVIILFNTPNYMDQLRSNMIFPSSNFISRISCLILYLHVQLVPFFQLNRIDLLSLFNFSSPFSFHFNPSKEILNQIEWFSFLLFDIISFRNTRDVSIGDAQSRISYESHQGD